MSGINIGNLQTDEDVQIGEINIPVITPKRGIDYWTPSDKQEVVDEAIDAVNAVVMPQEQTRQNNETTRQNNEETRQNNEATRQENEATRQANEAERIENETAREERFAEIETLIDNLEDDIEEIQSEIPTKTSDLINDSDFVEDEDYVHTDNNFTDTYKNQIDQNTSDISSLDTNKADKTEIPTKTSDLTNDSGFIDKSVNDLTNYTLKTNTGSLIDLEINGTTYVITLSLKNQDGTIISSDTIDLPLESVVVGGSYDSVNQKIVLTLENGNTVDIPVGDLIAGLQTEITSQNKLASDLIDDTNSGNKFVTTSEKQTWNAKYDKPAGGIPSTDLADSVLANYVKNTDYASSNVGGVVKTDSTYGIVAPSSTGLLQCYAYTYQEYTPKGNRTFISKGTLENVITGKNLETANNKVTSISSSSTDTEFPSAKCVYDIVGDIESILEELDIGSGV